MIDENEKCDKCGSWILDYGDEILCTKCDCKEIAKIAKECCEKQIKGVDYAKTKT